MLKDEHNQYIGCAFIRRRTTRKKLKAAQERLQQTGEWMGIAGGCLPWSSTNLDAHSTGVSGIPTESNPYTAAAARCPS